MVLGVLATVLLMTWFSEAHDGPRADRLARQLLYYAGTEVELNIVLAVPMKAGQHSVTLGFFWEANYDLPPYNSQAIYIRPQELLEDRLRNPPGRRSVEKQRPPGATFRPVHRAALYRALEIVIERRLGFPNTEYTSGRACVLRSICEAAAWPLQHDGLVGELLHVLLTPSTTVENGALHSDYLAAERLGRRGVDCGATFPACPSSPLDLVSTLSRKWNWSDI